jgi:hypothetical protein
MITSWFWLLANFALIIAFFTFSPSSGKPNPGFVYLRNGLIPLIAAMNFSSQVMVFHAHYYYGSYCTSTCCKLRKASYGLAITSLILSLLAFVDIVLDNSREPAPVAVNAVVPVQTSHVQYTEEPGHYNYVQQAPTQVDNSLKKRGVPFRTLSTTQMALSLSIRRSTMIRSRSTKEEK